MKLLLVTLSVALVATTLSLVGAGQTPPSKGIPGLAYISTQRILTESPVAKTELAKLQNAQQQKTTELRGKQQTLETTRLRLAQAADAAARTELEKQEQEQRADLERATTQAQTELQALQRQFQTDFQTRLRPIVDDLAKEQSLQLVLSADTSVLWAAPGMDLTSLVLARLNAPAPASPAPKP